MTDTWNPSLPPRSDATDEQIAKRARGRLYYDPGSAHPTPKPLDVVIAETAREFAAVCVAEALRQEDDPAALLVTGEHHG